MTWAALLWGNSLGPPPDRSGVSGVTCSTSACHNDFPANVGGGSVSITGLPEEWTPGVTYPLQVSVSHSGASLYGFQMTGVDSNGAQAGGFVIGTGTALQSGSAGGNTIEHIQHSFATTNSMFSFSWTAPGASSTGAVKFNVAANAANGSFSRFGDFIYSTETTVSPQTTDNGPLQTTFYFPQIADGTLPGGFFKTTIFVVNPASSGSANVTITFTTSAGDPFNVSFVDSDNQPVGSGNVVTIASLAGGQSRKLISTAATALTVGFATVTADASIVASAVFSQFSGTPAQGTLLSEAAVTSAGAVSNQAIFVDERRQFPDRAGLREPLRDNAGERDVQPAVPQRRRCACCDDHGFAAGKQSHVAFHRPVVCHRRSNGPAGGRARRDDGDHKRHSASRRFPKVRGPHIHERSALQPGFSHASDRVVDTTGGELGPAASVALTPGFAGPNP